MYKKHILFVHKLGPVLIWSYLAHISHTALAVITHLLLTDCFINCYCLFPTSCEVRMTQRGKCCRILKTMWREVKKKADKLHSDISFDNYSLQSLLGKKKEKQKQKNKRHELLLACTKSLGKKRKSWGKVEGKVEIHNWEWDKTDGKCGSFRNTLEILRYWLLYLTKQSTNHLFLWTVLD